MTRQEFLDGIAPFTAWLIDTLPTYRFQLKFSPSKFVPGGCESVATGLEQVLQNYMWTASWSDHGVPVSSSDWDTTRLSLSRLRARLCDAQCREDNEGLLEACLAVLRWGGVSGAKPFLRRKANSGQLVAYLGQVQQLLALDGEQHVEDITGQVIEQFDSGMTKIHALLDTTGSPIYDSRVGAAMAMLLELFRRSHPEHETNPALQALRFPSGSPRGRQIRNPGFFGAGYRSAPQFYTQAVKPAYWAQSQLQLGWLIRDVLARTNLFGANDVELAARCHAFEAALFIIGYDLRCFGTGDCSQPETPPGAPSGGEPVFGWVPTGHPFATVMERYFTYRRQSGQQYDHARQRGFQNWLGENGGPVNPATQAAYCFPLRAGEFDLFDSSLDEIEQLTAALSVRDTAGILAFLDSFEMQSDERRHVCLVNAWCVGFLRARKLGVAQSCPVLVCAGFARTENAAQTLQNVGSRVGRTLQLLTTEGLPTDLYDTYFGGKMDELEAQLNVALEAQLNVALEA